MDIQCPLCGMNLLQQLDLISTPDLNKLYLHSLKVDISPDIKDIHHIIYLKCKTCDLNFFYPPCSASESLYENLQQFDWYYQDEKTEFEIATKFIGSGDDVLEIGCGKGAFSDKIISKSYIGLELSQSAIIKATAKNHRVLMQTIEAHSQTNERRYSVVCAFQVLEHVENPRSFIEGSIKCLKEGGYLILSVPSEDSFISSAVNNPLNMPPHHITRWTDRSLQKVGELFDLDLIHLEHEKLSDIHLRWYSQTMSMKTLRHIIPLKSGLIETSVTFKIMSRVSVYLSYIFRIILTNKREKPPGHSVVVIFQRKIESGR